MYASAWELSFRLLGLVCYLMLLKALNCSAPSPPCNTGEGVHVGKNSFVCYFAAVRASASLDIRNDRCMEFNATLASISDRLSDSYLNIALIHLLPNASLSFIVIGTNDISVENQFTDISGNVLSWSPWGENEPDAAKGHLCDCVAISRVFQSRVLQYDYECYHQFSDNLCAREVPFSGSTSEISETEANMSGSLFTNIGSQIVEKDSLLAEIGSIQSRIRCCITCTLTDTCIYFEYIASAKNCRLFRVTYITKIEDVYENDYFTINLWGIRNLK